MQFPLKSDLLRAIEGIWRNLGKLWYPSKGGMCVWGGWSGEVGPIHHGQCGRVG